MIYKIYNYYMYHVKDTHLKVMVLGPGNFLIIYSPQIIRKLTKDHKS